MYSPVCVIPGRNPNFWFSHALAQLYHRRIEQAKMFIYKIIFQEHGFFVECRAFTGEDRSNSLFLESTRKWTGLLIEADPELYAQLRYKNRKSFTVNACLSPEPHPVMVSEPPRGKTNNVVSEQAGHKPTCTSREKS